jgi:hypothetical protein
MLILVAFGLTSLTVLIHGVGTLAVIGRLSRSRRAQGATHRPLASGLLIVCVVSVLLFLHLIEASLWAGFLWLEGALTGFETAMYFSLTSYTTVGYGDVVLPGEWRLLGPIEAGVGILMFGWSTGIMVAAITKAYGGRLGGAETTTSAER